jgi:hypothetical protein
MSGAFPDSVIPCFFAVRLDVKPIAIARSGRPALGASDFWCEAEREWIASRYVPHRTIEDRG